MTFTAKHSAAPTTKIGYAVSARPRNFELVTNTKTMHSASAIHNDHVVPPGERNCVFPILVAMVDHVNQKAFSPQTNKQRAPARHQIRTSRCVTYKHHAIKGSSKTSTPAPARLL